MEKIFFTIMAFIFGLLTGSFLNVCIYRIPAGKSIVYPRSHCYSCGTYLKVRDLFPVLSHFFSGGICRTCGSVISFRYSFIELLTATLTAVFFYKFYFSLTTLFFIIILHFMIIITFIDLDYLIIPDGISVGGTIAGFFINFLIIIFAPYEILEIAGYNLTFESVVLGILLGGGSLFLISVLSGGGMGGGDIKLMAAIGAWFGVEFTASVLFLSFILGAVIGVFLIITKIKSRKDYVPFGPYIAVAVLITMYFGSDVMYKIGSNIIWNLRLGI
ncbi:MAG: prepilin peptidase [Candidatus Muirbacterium halophilum]|nr:prepilin peptidase [Candidatus Muirbacterium halophilum]MCK9476833.1 prepilin peptidase [Candidatus Muirbacterium halophilum]